MGPKSSFSFLKPLQRWTKILSHVTARMRVDPRDLKQRVLGSVHQGTAGPIFLITPVRSLFIFLICICIISAIFFLNYPHHSANQYSPNQRAGIGKLVTFTPTVIPLSAPEIANPWKGPQYYSDESPPPNWLLVDHYNRWCWRDIEPRQGQYNFAPIDAVLTAAKAHGGKGGFTIMPTNPSSGGTCMPDYLMALMPHGGWYINTQRNLRTYEPDWNDPHYLARLRALVSALGERYDHDPRLGWVDLFAYGSWNEWNLAGWPAGSPVGTPATKRAIIDMNIQAFPDKYLAMNTDGYGYDGTGYDALDYALSRSPKVAIRMNCLGYADMGGAIRAYQADPALATRWQTAPSIVEYCGGPDFQAALQQIKTYHFAMIGDGAGNINSFRSYSPADEQLLLQNYKTSGYRFVLDRLTLPSHIEAGGGFSVTTAWSNVNVTPAYNPWQVLLQLRNSSGTIAWQQPSSLDLQTLLPTTDASGKDTPVSITDTFTLPKTLVSGSYTVAVQIIDPDHYYRPLQLAIQGKQADGSYYLGSITIGQ